ncbi:DUF6232 family protein [Frateuria defendens]|uniref:DUF6232 family protein n=1 Tax=Frateuria defendens TaxID=2219559 RepID=UPI0009E623A8|nr:DUF6232 family protein [Frateuria defendens]
MEEKIFFDQGGVSVSNARFIVHEKTYAMNGVTSVKQVVTLPSRGGPIIVGLFGLVAMFAGSIIAGAALLAAAVFWWIKQKSDWLVVLSSSSGETQALTSKDRGYIDAVIAALNQSIVHRG